MAEPAGTWTYAEYKDWLTKIGQAGGGKYFGGSDFTGIWWQFNIWLRQKGIDAFTGDGKLGFSKDDLRTWLNLDSDLRGTNAVVPADRSAQVKPKSPFGSNLTVSENTWDNFMAGYLKDSGAKELKLVPVPSDDPDNLGLFLKPSMLMVASAKTKNKDAAARFIDFMVNDPEVGEIFKTSPVFPPPRPSGTAPPSKAPTKPWWTTKPPSASTSRTPPNLRSSASAPSRPRSFASMRT